MRKRVIAPQATSQAKRGKVTRRTYIPKSLFGNKVRNTLKYIEHFQLNAGAAGIPASYVFTANGLFDPNITGIGHQPRGFDQLKELFDHYHVVQSKIKVTFMPGSTAGPSQICGIMLQDDSTPEANMIQAMEGRNCVYGPLTSTVPLVKTLYFNSKTFFSIEDRLLYGTSTSNPSDQAYFVLFCQPTYSVDAPAIDVMVEIQYDTCWSEPNNVGKS